MDESEDLYAMEEEHDDVGQPEDDTALSQQQRLKKLVYPPRLMVDFKSLGLKALQRYAKFYHLKVEEGFPKDDLAVLVARHFDCSLNVEEDDSIVAFMQCLRNGERSTVKRSTAREKERKALANAEKKRKSNSRKRGRDHSVSTPSRGSSSAGQSANSGNVHTTNATHGHGHGSTSASHGHTNGHTKSRSETRKPPSHASTTNSKPTNSTGKPKKPKMDPDVGEDNELYCICNLPSYGNMIACDGKTCPNPSQWYHLECVGLADGRHPDTWLCPECDPKGFNGGSSNSHKKKKTKTRSKSPGRK